MTIRSPWFAITALVAACGGPATPTPEIPPIDDESMAGERSGGGETSAEAALPTEGGPRVRLGRVRLAAGASLTLPGAACLEAVVFVESGNLRTPADEDLPGGTLYRTQRETALAATEDAVMIVALNRPAAAVPAASAGEDADADDGVEADDDETEAEAADDEAESEAGDDDAGAAEPVTAACTERVMGDVVADIGSLETLENAEGKLKVRILLDREGGASFGSFALLEGDADLGVPVHTHPGVAEVLFIDAGDGTMKLGDESFQVTAGQVIYVPPDTEHGYEAGSEALRAYQVYGPPGPEQRFRGPAPESATP